MSPRHDTEPVDAPTLSTTRIPHEEQSDEVVLHEGPDWPASATAWLVADEHAVVPLAAVR